MFETAERDAAIMAWREKKKQLDKIKEEELELRKQVMFTCFAYEGDDREGTHNLELGNGYKLKAVFKLNRRLENEEDAVKAVLKTVKSMPGMNKLVTDRLVKWQPKLSITEYNNLPAEVREVFDAVVTSKPGTPSLELVEPKGK